MDIVTSFTVMHWVQQQITSYNFFKKILKPNGKLIAYVLTGHAHDNIVRMAFNQLKEDCSEMLRDVEYKHDNLSFSDGFEWQSALKTGRIEHEDYRKLLERCGFKIHVFESQPLVIKVPKFATNMYLERKVLPTYADYFLDKTTFLEQFCPIFKDRLNAIINERYPQSDFIEHHYEGLKIFAEKK